MKKKKYLREEKSSGSLTILRDNLKDNFGLEKEKKNVQLLINVNISYTMNIKANNKKFIIIINIIQKAK